MEPLVKNLLYQKINIFEKNFLKGKLGDLIYSKQGDAMKTFFLIASSLMFFQTSTFCSSPQFLEDTPDNMKSRLAAALENIKDIRILLHEVQFLVQPDQERAHNLIYEATNNSLNAESFLTTGGITNKMNANEMTQDQIIPFVTTLKNLLPKIHMLIHSHPNRAYELMYEASNLALNIELCLINK